MMENLRNQQEQYWARVDKTNTCWLWRGTLTHDGHCLWHISIGGTRRRVRAHRAAIALHTGAFPHGRVVRHLCNVRACVRPHHLAVGTHADNVRHRVACGRCARGEHNGRAKLTREDVLRIRERLAAGEALAEIARDCGVCPRTVQNVRDGRTWRHV